MLREKHFFLVILLCSQCANGYSQRLNIYSQCLNTYSQATDKEKVPLSQGYSLLHLFYETQNYNII